MKVLSIFTERFGYKTTTKTIESMPDINEQRVYENVLVGFIQAEAEDEKDPKYIETKLVKNLKWAARKNETENIVLHSFAHLSNSKASVDFTREILDNAEKRMAEAGYKVAQTPFGYFLDLDLKAPGKSQARIFKQIDLK